MVDCRKMQALRAGVKKSISLSRFPDASKSSRLGKDRMQKWMGMDWVSVSKKATLVTIAPRNRIP